MAIAWSDVWVGAAIAALLLTTGKALIGLYLARSTVASAYGAASSLVIILTWVYYSAQIVLFGAEITQVYSHQHGSQMQALHLVAVPSGATTAGGALCNN